MSWSCLNTLRHMGTEPCIFQGKERKHGGGKDHQHVLLGLQLSSHLTTWKGAAWAGCSCCPRLSLSGAMRWQDAAWPSPAHSSLQVSGSHLICKLWDYKHYKKQSAKPWINLWRSLIALAVAKVLGSLWVMKHVALHVLPTVASPLTVAGESTRIVTACSEIHHRAWRWAWVMSNDGDQVWYSPTILISGEKNMAYTKLPHFGHTLLPTAPYCTEDI